MALIDFDGLTWFPPETPPSRVALSDRGFIFEDANNRNVSVEQSLGFKGIRLSLPTQSTGSLPTLRGSFGRSIPDLGGSLCVGFVVPPDYTQTGDTLGFIGPTLTGPPSVSGYRAQGVGFQRDASGIVCLAYKNALGGAEWDRTAWVEIPEGVWRENLPNTVYVLKQGNDYSLFVNDSSALTEVSVSAVITGVGVACAATAAGVTAVCSLPILSTGPMGVLGFQTYRPLADGPSDFTPDSGETGFSRLNEGLPDGDASYVKAAADGSRALYSYGGADGVPIEIQAQQAVLGVKCLFSAKVSGADTRYLRALAGDAVAEEAFGVFPVRGEYETQGVLANTNPLTGLVWQPEDFDDLKLGFLIDDEAV